MLCTQNGFDLEALKKDTNTLMDLYKLAEQNAKLKSDKNWTKFELPGTNKKLEETLKAYTEAVETAKYWYDNIAWLQNQFPNAQYQDVVGLCKMADPTEYADEHDYSLNAGRYVGVVIGEDNKTEEEFKNDLECKAKLFKTLNSESEKMELNISEHLINLLL